MAGGDMPLTVLQSFPVPRPPAVNPYTALLAEHLRAVPGVTVLNFTWKTALSARYDVFHAHWPEILVDGHSPLKKIARQALTIALLARLRAAHIPIVRTVHNIGLPSGISRRESYLLGVLDHQTTARIRLNGQTPVPDGSPVSTIPHAHFRDWFAGYEPAAMVAGQVGYIGRVRRYKGVERFIEAFRGAAKVRDELTARVAGYPSSAALADSLVRMADGDPRIGLQLRFISDAELVDVVTSSELLVFPYREMHNSSAAITALSLDRPILVPSNAVNEELSREVGPGWVHLFEGELTGRRLLDVLDIVRRHPGRPRPDLDRRDWGTSASDHARVYGEAIELMRRRR
jgi:beta-1,4-mannosyltransferase